MGLESLVSILVAILVLAIIIYAVNVLVGFLKIPAAIRTLIYLIIAVVVILWLVRYLGVL